MRANTNITLKDRHQLRLTDFKGVDFSSSPLRVQQNRASDMSNFINEYGVNRKRNGWKELFRIELNRVPQRINGVFYYVNRERREMIVHAGKRFYRIENNGLYNPEDITLSSTYEEAKCDLSILKDQRSQAFFNKGKMYIIGCGDYLVYGSWNGGLTYELRRVFDNEDTYIPTTTLSIDNDSVTEVKRASRDDVNCLSSRRINQFLGIADLPPWKVSEGGIDENTTVALNFLDKTITNNGEDKSVLYDGELVVGSVNFKEGSIRADSIEWGTYVSATYIYQGVTHEEKIERITTWTVDTGSIDKDSVVNITLETMNGEEVVTRNITNNAEIKSTLMEGNVPVGDIDFEKGKITLIIDTTPPIENGDNIFVTFKHTIEGYAERITNCNFGILFGANGNTDRLFLSGNADYPNIDFHSGMDDFTYFGDFNTSSMGSDSVAVNGYGRLSDSTLVIYKEETGQEASIYYRTGSYQESYDGEGNLESFRGVFPTYAGSIGEGVIGRYACANFAGDNLILSRNGVFGIVLSNNVATAERYVRERSRSINERLRTHKDLSEAVAIVYKNRYYLAIDGVCYIADSRFKYTREDDIDGSYNYEWWVWDNIPARVWANINNELYFGTPDGQVCVFDNEYTDRTYQITEAGDLSLDIVNNKISYNSNIRVGLIENDIIKFSTGEVYALYLDDFKVSKNRIYVSEDLIMGVQEGTEVYADNISSGDLLVKTKYIVSEVDRGDCSFALIDEKGESVEFLLNGSFRLCKRLLGKELYITNVLDTSFQIKEGKEAVALTLTNYNGATPTSIIAKVTHKENVVAKWYTPVFDLGTNESSKTLLKMTVSTEAEINGKLSFGYETRSANKFMAAKGINVFSFDNFSFEDFSFDTGFASSYSVKVKERNFNFIIFRFISDSDSACAVNNFTIVYKINKQNKGVE